ncbi:MAG: acyltransferase [Bryobacterales bacterium]|nr:acyltransferase [Bryobacterales bacterium]
MKTACAAGSQMPALTGLRFYLAVWVVVHHLCGGARMLEPFVRSFPGPVQTYLRSGFWAVGTFFVLSGFVLARGYAATVWNRASLLRYGAARIARIYPVYLFSLLVIAPFVYQDLFSAPPGRAVPGKLFLLINYSLALQGWTGTLPVHWNTPAWSLSCELFFYVCFPAVLLLWRFGGWRRSLGAAGAALVLPVVLPLAGLPEDWKPLTHFGDFLLGIALAGIYDLLLSRKPGLKGRGYWLYVPAAVLGAAVVALPGLVEPWSPPELLLRPLNAFLLLGLALGGGLVARVLSAPGSVLLGKASYALYILHIPVLWWYKRSWLFRLASPWPAGAAVIYIAGVVAISTLVFKLIEEPANRRLRTALAARFLPAPRRSLPAPLPDPHCEAESVPS